MTPTREVVRIPIDDTSCPTMVAALIFPERTIAIHRVYTSQDPRDGAWYMAEYAGQRSCWYRHGEGKTGEERALDDLLPRLDANGARKTLLAKLHAAEALFDCADSDLPPAAIGHIR